MKSSNKTEVSNSTVSISSVNQIVTKPQLFGESFEKIDCTIYTRVAIDAEWFKNYLLSINITAEFLTKQFTFMDDSLRSQLTIILWNSDFPLPDRTLVVDHPVRIISCDVQNIVLKDICLLAKKLSCYMYYSPKDVEAMVGTEVWRNILLSDERPISKLRNLSGAFKFEETEYRLKDCFGAFNTSLDAAMIAVGVDNPYKNNVEKMSQDKGKMDIFMREHPNEFLEYAFGDTAYLGETLNKRVEQANKIIKQALGDVITYTVDNFPMSAGSLVAKTFEAWLIAEYPKLMQKALKFSDANDNKHWGEIKEIKRKLEGDITPLELTKINNQLRSSDYVSGLAMGSIRNFALLSRHTGLFGAMVMGGRCINENPHQNPFDNRVTNVIDIDLKGCYGDALSKFDFPLGIPTIYERAIDDKVITLEDFLKKSRKDLIPGLYTIIVKGKLPFEQDLIHSKYGLTTAKIQRTILGGSYVEPLEDIYGRELDTAHIGGDFLLTKKQIENGIITADVLEVIEKVSANDERGAFNNLEVVAAIYYPKSLEKTNDEWLDVPIGGKYAKGDKRTRCWTRIPLSNFIDKFISYRNSVKEQKETKNDSFDLLQNGVKLFINTTYGDFAAPYFPMGNTVLANNITAKARVGVWKLSKALLTAQSITDGGMFSKDKVAVIDKTNYPYNPGFHTMADRSRFLKHRAIKTEALTPCNVWKMMKAAEIEKDAKGQKAQKDLDKLCLDHINRFWNNYDLDLPFAIECKYENTALEAIYFGSSDYLLSQTAGGVSEYIKCRGAKEADHPKQLWLKHLLNPAKFMLPNPSFNYTQLVGVNDFLVNNRQPAYEILLPGDEMSRVTWHRPYTNGEVYLDYKEYKDMTGAKSKAIRRHEKLVTEEPDNTQLYFYLAKQVKEEDYKYTKPADNKLN